ALLAKVLESLGLLNFRSIFDENVAKRTPETGREVIDSDWFKEWLMDLLGGIVWGTGMPGAGKTVLACIVIERLQKLVEESESKDICLLFAFCRYTERLMVIDILLAILRQLLERHPQVLPYVKPMYERHKRENTRPSEAQVVDLLRQIATSGLFKKTLYILDGLDEAASDIQVDLIEILSSLPVHFFITSRPLDTLKDLVPNARFFTIIASDPDIALLIDQKIHRIPALRKLLINDATLKSEVVSIISSKSSGMFLLASLHLDMLKGCASESDVRKALEVLPIGMDGMYDKTMDRIRALPGPQAELAKRVLIWVTYAQEPLSAEELVLAVSVCPETFRFDGKRKPADIDAILSLCCGLVQLEASLSSSADRFEDYSAAEYMVEKLEQHYPDDPHALIASTCISFLRHYGFHDVSSLGCGDDAAIWDRFASLRQEQTSMANYPYKYWGFHVAQSRMILPSALAFLDDCRQYPSFPTHDDRGYIHDAAGSGKVGMVSRFLGLGLGANINARDENGHTALAHAVLYGSRDVVMVLLGIEGIDYNCVDSKSRTPLTMAAEGGFTGIVDELLELEGIRIDSRDDEGLTAMAYAVSSHSGNPRIIRSVLQLAQFDVNARDIYGRTALAYAVRSGSYYSVEALLKVEGVNIRCVDEQGITLLMCAAGRGEVAMVSRFLGLGLGANTNAKDAEGRTALAHAASRGLREVIRVLLGVKGIDYNCVDAKGQTPLMKAARSADDGAVAVLVELERIEINSKDNKGRTALAHA
ncbi:ankyrin, partial [Coprinopsis marcescibilis]